ncbi:hypothetical protein CED78_24370, partial [Salmonella enterica subsp. enterica serovar Typhimurium]|nr:hypothetical protein [Salmonella enterica subsp. enterica serovar Typhimurium]
MSIKNDGHYFCRAGGNRPDGLNEPVTICPPQETTHRQTTDKTKGPVFRLSLLFYLMSGSSLLSHGETPHYH